MERGGIVFILFPFTDLSATKRRPALVLSPQGFHPEGVILCAITSRIPQQSSRWEVRLDSSDLIRQNLPKPSIIKVGKLFTMHKRLIAGEFGTITPSVVSHIMTSKPYVGEHWLTANFLASLPNERSFAILRHGSARRDLADGW